MHRLGVVQQYNNNTNSLPTRDGRSYLHHNLIVQNCNPFFGNNDVFHHHPPTLAAPSMTNRVYPPGSNSRLAGLLASTPSATSTFKERGGGNCGPSQVFMNRMNIMQQYSSGYHSNHATEVGGTGNVVGGYSAQKLRNDHHHGHLMPPQLQHQQHQHHHLPQQQQQPAFGGMGFSSNGGGVRYHPYQHHHHPHYHPPTPHYQEQQQQKSAGFLEQLLKNRGGHQMGYYNPYGRRSPQQSALGPHPFMAQMTHHRFPSSSGGNNNIPGYGRVASSSFSLGPRGVLMSGCYPHPQHSLYHQQQQLNWGARGGVLGGGASNPFHLGAVQSVGDFHRHPPNPFYQHGLRQNNSNFFQVIKNEPEDSEPEEQPNREIQDSEARYRKNHERMNAIMNENLVDCSPIQVPMQRVESLKHHVQLLQEDLNKHKDDTVVVQENCTKRLQDFQEATTKYHVDYQKLCEPMDENEYNELVDKYYREMKDKKEPEEAKPKDDGGDGVVIDLTCNQHKNENDLACHVENGESTSPLDCSGRDDRDAQRAQNVVTPNDDYFDHPLFIDVPSDENENTSREQEPSGEHQPQENRQVFGEDLTISSAMEQVEGSGGNAASSDLFFGGQHHNHQFDPNQQQQQIGYSYYPSGSSTLTNAGSTTQLEDLIMPPAAHSQPGSNAQQQQIFMSGHQINANVNFAYQTQQYNDAGAYSLQQRHQFLNEQQQPSGPPPQVESTANTRVRPTEELTDFILDLVRAKYPQGEVSPLLHQHQAVVPSSSTQTTPSDIPEPQFQQRRLMSGGGIVEVKRTSPIPPVDHRPLIYDDTATQEWINSLTNVTEDSNDAPVTSPLATADVEQDNQDSNNNLQMDLNHDEVVAAAVASTTNTTNNSDSSSLIAKNSKIAEILQGPCLNDSADEFESELRQLEEALNREDVDTAISSMHRNSEDVRANDSEDNNENEDEQKYD